MVELQSSKLKVAGSSPVKVILPFAQIIARSLSVIIPLRKREKERKGLFAGNNFWGWRSPLAMPGGALRDRIPPKWGQPHCLCLMTCPYYYSGQLVSMVASNRLHLQRLPLFGALVENGSTSRSKKTYSCCLLRVCPQKELSMILDINFREGCCG